MAAMAYRASGFIPSSVDRIGHLMNMHEYYSSPSPLPSGFVPAPSERAPSPEPVYEFEVGGTSQFGSMSFCGMIFPGYPRLQLVCETALSQGARAFVQVFQFARSSSLWTNSTPIEKLVYAIVAYRLCLYVWAWSKTKPWRCITSAAQYVYGRCTRKAYQVPFVPKQNDDGKIVIIRGQRFYTDPVSHTTYRLVPKTARGAPGDSAQIDYELVPAGLEENALVNHGGVHQTFKVSDPSAFVLYVRTESGDVRAAHGYRDHDMGIVNRHVFQGEFAPFPGKFVNAYIRKNGSDMLFPIPSDTPIHFHGPEAVKYAGEDLAAFDPGPVFWSRVGIRAHSDKGFCVDTEGPVYMEYYNAQGQYVRASGHLQPTTSEDRAKGRIPYTIETENGCSGSPVYKLVNGVPKIVAIHSFGSVDSRPVNFGIVVPDLQHFRKQLGLVPIAERWMGDEKVESKTKANKQKDRWEDEEARKWYLSLSKKDQARYRHGLIWYDDEEDEGEGQMAEEDITRQIDEDYHRKHDPYSNDPVDDEPSSSDEDAYGTRGREEEAYARVKDKLHSMLANSDPGFKLEECAEFCEARALYQKLNQDRKRLAKRRERRAKQRERRKDGRDGKGSASSSVSRPGAEQAFPGCAPYRTRWDPTLDMPVMHDGKFGHATDPDYIDEALARAMTGRIQDLEAIFADGRLSPAAIRKHHRFRMFNDYLRAGEIQFRDPEHIEFDADGLPVLSKVANFCGIHTRSAPQKELSEKFKEACARYGVNMEDYIIPSNTPEEIMASLRGQLRGTKSIKRELTDEQHEILNKFYDRYPDAPHAYVGDVHAGVRLTLDSLDGDKSTGWSSLYKPGCKEVWKSGDGLALASYLTRCRIILRLAWGSAAMACMTPSQMIEEGLQDPRVLFIKPEPHGARKRATRQWRLIWVCSIVDILTAAQTHRSQDKRDIDAYQDRTHPNLPQVIGMGHHDLGIERLGEELDKVAAVNGKLCSSDCSGWDLSVQRQWVLWDARRRLLHGPPHPVFRELLYCEAYATTAHVVAIGTSLYSVNKAGITASGILSTGANNSSERAAVKLISGAEEVRTLGDDEFNSGNNSANIERWLGANIKGDAVVAGPFGPVHFTSHCLTKDPSTGKWKAQFLNLGKMLARIELTKAKDGKVSPDVLGGCLFVLRHDPEALCKFGEVCDAMGWSLDGVEPFYDEGICTEF